MSILEAILEIDTSGFIRDSDVVRSVDNCLFLWSDFAREACESELGREFYILEPFEKCESLSSPSIPSCFCSLYLSLISIPEGNPSILSRLRKTSSYHIVLRHENHSIGEFLEFCIATSYEFEIFIERFTFEI